MEDVNIFNQNSISADVTAGIKYIIVQSIERKTKSIE